MFNDISIGPVTLHMYGLMIALGFLFAYLLCRTRGKRQGLNDDIIFGIFICAIVGGLVGTRVLFYIVSIPDILKDPSILWNFKNGYVVYGGIIGGVLASFLYCRAKKVSFLTYFDLVMPSVSLGQGFGRLGCFCAGCCYGRETDSKFSIVFSHSDFAPNGVHLIPTQLISSAGDFAFCLFLLWFASKKPAKGRVAAMYLLLYGVGRFLIEFLRNDYRGSIGFLSTSQIISIGIVALGVICFFVFPKLAKRSEAKAE